MNLSRALKPEYFILSWIIIETTFWFRGTVVYDGDQSFLIYPGVNYFHYLYSLFYGVSYYPFLGNLHNNIGLFFYYLIISIFSAIPLKISEQLFTIFLLSLGSIYVYKLVLTFLGDNNKAKLAGVLGGIYFSSNWGLNFSGTFQTTLLGSVIIYPLLPIAIYYIKKLSTSFRYLGIASLLSAIILMNSGIVYIIQSLFIILLFAAYYLRGKWKYLLIFVFIISIIQLVWITPESFLSSTHQAAELLNFSYTLLENNSKLVPLYLVVTGLQYPYYASPSVPAYSYVLGYVIPSLLILPLFEKEEKKKEYLLWFGIAMLFTLFYSGFSTPFGVIYSWIFLHVPYLIDFRSPWYAFSFYQQFFYSVLIPIGVYFILSRLRNFIPIFILLFIVLNVVIPFPVVSGNIENRVYFPGYFLNTVNFLNEENGNFNVLLLPSSPTWFSSSWYVGNNMFVYFSNHEVFGGGLYDSQNSWLREAYSLLCRNIYEGNTSSLLLIYNLLYLLNVKYIVFQGDFKSSPLVHYNVSYEGFIKGLNKYEEEGLITLVRNYSPYYVYKVDINSSFVLEGNYLPPSSFQWLSKHNVSLYFTPVEYKFLNPVSVKIWNITGHYIFFVYSYDKEFNPNYKLFYGNLYVVNTSVLFINSSLQIYNTIEIIAMSLYYVFLSMFYFIDVNLRKVFLKAH